MHYYQINIKDFRAGTANMSRLERWIYRDLLDVYYDTEQPLTLDLDKLCREIGARSAEDRAAVAEALDYKFVKTEAGYRHERCEEEIAIYRAKAETAKENGKKGGRPRKDNPEPPGQGASGKQEKPSGFQSGSNQEPDGNQAETGSKTNQEPVTNNQEPVTTLSPPAEASGVDSSAPQENADAGESEKQTGVQVSLLPAEQTAGQVAKPTSAGEAAFEDAWALYPKRAGGNSRAEALKAWNARIKQGKLADDMIAGVKRYAAYCEAKGNIGTEFVKQASSFFGPSLHFEESWEPPPPTLTAQRSQRSQRPEKFDPIAFVNRNRVDLSHEQDHDYIDV